MPLNRFIKGCHDGEPPAVSCDISQKGDLTSRSFTSILRTKNEIKKMKENERESAVDIHRKLLVGLVAFSWPRIPQKAKYNHFRNWGELKRLILDPYFSACQVQVIKYSGIHSYSLLNFQKKPPAHRNHTRGARFV